MDHINFLELIILALATWRISNLLTDETEEGPYNVLREIRVRSYKYSSVLECLWCTSVWVAAALVSLVLIDEHFVLFIAPFALSTIAILIDKWSK